MVRKNVPLAQQVVTEILSHLDTGDLTRADGLLPSEAELVQRFHVSRATLREALAKLENAGIVFRRHGIGTYVNRLVNDHPAAIQYWLDDTASFSNLIASSGHEPQCQIMHTTVGPAGELASALGIDAESNVLSVSKVFLSDNAPLIHCVNVVPFERIHPDDRDAVLADGAYLESIYRFLEEHCHSKVHHQKSQVHAVVTSEAMSSLLQCAVGDPLLRVEEVGYGEDLCPVFYGLDHFRGDAVSFVQVRRPAISIGSSATP